MTPELLQLIIQGGGFGFAVWMLNNVWLELKVQNQRIYDLLQKQDTAALDRDRILSEVAGLKAQIAVSSSPSPPTNE